MKNIKKQNRKKSYKAILPTLGERHRQCLEGLVELGGTATANDLARHLLDKGVIPFYNTNYTNPRLIELEKKGYLHVKGKTKDHVTGRQCSIYEIA